MGRGIQMTSEGLPTRNDEENGNNNLLQRYYKCQELSASRRSALRQRGENCQKNHVRVHAPGFNDELVMEKRLQFPRRSHFLLADSKKEE